MDGRECGGGGLSNELCLVYENAGTGYRTGQARAHSLEETEILGFFGSNPEDPYDLGGEVELWLEDEMHLITRSSMVFIPSSSFSTSPLFKPMPTFQ